MAHRSLILSMEVTTVARAHECRYNKKHALRMGDRRLTIFSDGEKHNYCLECARVFLENDIKRLQTLLAEVQSHL